VSAPTRQPCLAWEPAWEDGFHFHIVLYECERYDHRLTLNVMRRGDDWVWEVGTTGVCFRTEHVDTALEAQLAAEDELVRIARVLLEALGVLKPIAEPAPPPPGVEPIHAAMNRNQAAAYFTRRRDKVMAEIRALSPADKLRTAADFIEAVDNAMLPASFRSTARELCQLVMLGLPERQKRGGDAG
jgi:hypothetical protein